MELLQDIRQQVLETIREIEADLDELRAAAEDDGEVSEDLEERVKAHAASLIAATGALRALDEALGDDDDDE